MNDVATLAVLATLTLSACAASEVQGNEGIGESCGEDYALRRSIGARSRFMWDVEGCQTDVCFEHEPTLAVFATREQCESGTLPPGSRYVDECERFYTEAERQERVYCTCVCDGFFMTGPCECGPGFHCQFVEEARASLCVRSDVPFER